MGVVLFVNCLKTNLNLCIKTEPVTVTTVYVWFMIRYSLPKARHICIPLRCIRSKRERLGFYAEIQSIFGTVRVHGLMQIFRLFLGQCGLMKFLPGYVKVVQCEVERTQLSHALIALERGKYR